MKIKFTTVMVLISIVLCVIYGVVAIGYQYKTGEELSPTLTQYWFQVFGTEIAGTVIIYITKRITSLEKIQDKLKLKKDNNIEIDKNDFRETDGYDYNEYPEVVYDDNSVG